MDKINYALDEVVRLNITRRYFEVSTLDEMSRKPERSYIYSISDEEDPQPPKGKLQEK